MNNIKATINFHMQGIKHPFLSTQTHEGLLEVFKPFENWFDTNKKYNINGKDLTVLRTTWEVLDETMDLHIEKGVDSSLSGDAMPFNLVIRVYFAKG